jgi:uncharacterized protein YjbI with pentapeptide repeats
VPKRSAFARSVVVAAVSALSLLGITGVSQSAFADAVALAPVPGSGPSITVVNPDLTPKLDSSGDPQTTPQVGTLLLAEPGTWNDMAGTAFTYQWATVNPGTGATTKITGAQGTAKDYVPIDNNVGLDIQVTVTATNAANGDTPGSASVVTESTAVGLNPSVTAAPTSGQPYTTSFGATPAYATTAWLTMYGFPDNTPPSAGIAAGHPGSNITFPDNNVGQGIHTQAGGTGTYADPITFATSSNELWYGTEIYIPRFHKYFIGEDSCTECSQDMRGASPNNPDGTIGPGPDGGPGMIHFDLWVGGQNADWPDVILCEDALTLNNADGSPFMDPIIVNPGPNEVVDTTPIFDPTTDKCNTQPDGSSTSLDSSIDVGPYQNVPGPAGATGTPDGTGLCITDPGNSVTVGTQVMMEPCDNTQADQNLSFAGAFLIFNNLCLDMGNGLGGNNPGSTSSVRLVTLQRCNLNADQQWELNDDGTISDIQSSNWALADQGNGVLVATRNDNFAYNYWNFPFLRNADNTAPVAVSTSSVRPGSSLHVTGSGLTTPTAAIHLVSASNPAGVSLGTVTAAADGTFAATVTIPSSVGIGKYEVQIQGLTNVVPAGTAITDQSQLQYGTLANFAELNRTAPITGVSSDITVVANCTGCNLSGADLSGASFPGVNLSGANLQNANLQDTNLQGDNLSGVNFSGANLSGATLQGANLKGANLSGATLPGANLKGDNLQGDNLQGASASGAALQGANLQGITASGADFSGSNLQGANLQGGQLSNANFHAAQISGANLSAAALQNANLSDADLSGSNLQSANLTSATLAGANASGANLKKVVWSATTCPDGTTSDSDGGTCTGHLG